HRLGVGVDVGGRDVGVRTDGVAQLDDEAPRDLAPLVSGELLRIADDAPLRAAEWDVRHRALPRHPRRQRAHFVAVDVGVVADAALPRAAHARVLRAITGEGPDAAVVHHHRELHFDEARA